MAKIPILCYHNVGSAPANSLFKLLYVRLEDFERQLWTIRRLGLRGVSAGTGLRELGSKAKNDFVVLTFDDGYADTLAEALPLLLKYRCTATCYLVSDAIGTYNSWDAEVLSETKPLMNHEQVRLWLAAGMEIGSHSRSHPRLETMDSAAAYDEIAASRDSLRTAFGASIDHFCYPFGRFAEATPDLVKRAGYLSAVSLLRGIANAADDRYRLPRIFVNGERGWARFLLQIATPSEDFRRVASGHRTAAAMPDP
jgi:peptidoglycan/xylan/chitin deacetylase (PgdA/CDA1 family)